MDVLAFGTHPFLAGLTADQCGRLEACSRDVTYREGTYIFREGDPADRLYLVRAGCVALEQYGPAGATIRVETLAAGDILGLSWLFPSALWTLDARAVDAVHASVLPAARLRDWMREDQALGLELLTRLVQALHRRLVRVRLQRLDVYKAGV